MKKSIKNKIRPTYWVIRKIILNNRVINKYYINNHIGKKLINNKCPICESKEIYEIKFYYYKENIIKNYCYKCGHIFTNNLNADIDKGYKLFRFDQENEHINDQKYLLNMMVLNFRKKDLNKQNFLDFGIGGNYRHLLEMNNMYNHIFFDGCDIYPDDKPFYFQCYKNENKIGIYDGISSNAVIEHLDDTVNSWKYLNNLLKPLKKGGGIMVHSFPSQMNEDYFHWAIKIKSHECLFSKKSLEILCDKTGFELITIKYNQYVQHPIFIFNKIMDIN